MTSNLWFIIELLIRFIVSLYLVYRRLWEPFVETCNMNESQSLMKLKTNFIVNCTLLIRKTVNFRNVSVNFYVENFLMCTVFPFEC